MPWWSPPYWLTDWLTTTSCDEDWEIKLQQGMVCYKIIIITLWTGTINNVYYTSKQTIWEQVADEYMGRKKEKEKNLV